MLDVNSNRLSRKWTINEHIGRVSWSVISPLFFLSPRIFWSWRVLILRLFGAKIGRDVHIYPSVRITIPWNLEVGNQSAVGDRAILYALGRITIGERTTVSQGAHLCAGTHDIRDSARPLLKLPIKIGNDAWICADAFIGPGASVGSWSVVGARAVVMKDVADHFIVVGNPARFIRRNDQ